MARPSNTLRKTVELYVGGPAHLRGDWGKCSIAAGADAELPRDNMAQRLVEQAGGVLVSAEFDPPAADLGELLQAAEDGSIPWVELRSKLTHVVQSIANGTVKASAAQVSMLKFVIERAEQQSASNDQATNVILLPTQGADGSLRIDEAWRARFKLLEGEV